MATQLNDFGSLAQAVWAAHSIGDKLVAFDVMVEKMISNQEKKTKFRREARAMNGRRLDRFASDVMLVDNHKRIR